MCVYCLDSIWSSIKILASSFLLRGYFFFLDMFGWVTDWPEITTVIFLGLGHYFWDNMSEGYYHIIYQQSNEMGYLCSCCLYVWGYFRKKKNGKVIRNNGKQAIAKIFAFLLFYKRLCFESRKHNPRNCPFLIRRLRIEYYLIAISVWKIYLRFEKSNIG